VPVVIVHGALPLIKISTHGINKYPDMQAAAFTPPPASDSICYELPNLTSLRWLIDHPELVNELSAKQKADEAKEDNPLQYVLNRNLLNELKQYLKRYKRGRGVKVKYHYGKGKQYGRLYSNGFSMQNAPRVIREILCHGSHIDLDFESATPSILDQILDDMDIPHPLLKEYVADRPTILEDILKQYDLISKDAKRIPLKLIYGSGLYYKQHPWLSAFYNECVSVHDAVCEKSPDIYEEKKKQIEKQKKKKSGSIGGSVVSSIVCAVENLWLLSFKEFVTTKGFDVTTLIFDGMHLKGTDAPLLDEASDYIFEKTRYRVKIAVKPIEYHDLDILVPPPPPVEDADDTEYTDGTVPAPLLNADQFLAHGILNDLLTEADLGSLKAGMMMGKSTCLREYLRPHYDAGLTILLVCCRRESVKDTVTKCEEVVEDLGVDGMQFVSYSELKERRISSNKSPHLVCCYESSHRIIDHYDIVSYDEFRSITAATVSRTNGDKMYINWDKHKYLTAYANKVLFLCADMMVDGAAYDAQDMLLNNRRSERSGMVLALAAAERAAVSKQDADYNARTRTTLINMGVNINHDASGDAEEDAAVRVTALLNLAMDIKIGNDANGRLNRIVNTVVKLRRVVKYTDRDDMLVQLTRDIADNRRIGIPVGSRNDGEKLKAFLESQFCGLNVGLFTALTDDDIGDVSGDIRKEFDKYDVIIFTSRVTTGVDYIPDAEKIGPIYRVYVFPKLNTFKPREAHQMIGRFRELVTCEVWVCADGDVPVFDLKPEHIRKKFAHELQILQYGDDAVQSIKHRNAKKLKFSIGPDKKEFQYGIGPSPHDLMVLQAWDNTEKSYCNTNSLWLSYFNYMSQGKGYTAEFPESSTDDEYIDERIALVKEYKAECKAVKEVAECEFSVIDVSAYIHQKVYHS
jgi:Origin of replication binding protein